MEFDIKVKIDWLEGDGTLDDAVKDQIVDRVAKALSKGTVASIAEASQKRIEERLDALVSETYEGFMNEKITVTDDWGKPVYKNVKIIDIIKQKLTAALNESVDDHGRPTTYGGRPRLTYLIQERVARAVDEIVATLDQKIKELLTAAVKEKLSASLLAKIDVDSAVEGVLGKLRG